MKKIVALVLALVLALSLATVAFAADETGYFAAKEGSLIKLENATLEKVKEAGEKNVDVYSVKFSVNGYQFPLAGKFAVASEADYEYVFVAGDKVTYLKQTYTGAYTGTAELTKVATADDAVCGDIVPADGVTLYNYDGKIMKATDSLTFKSVVKSTVEDGLTEMIGDIVGFTKADWDAAYAYVVANKVVTTDVSDGNPFPGKTPVTVKTDYCWSLAGTKNAKGDAESAAVLGDSLSDVVGNIANFLKLVYIQACNYYGASYGDGWTVDNLKVFTKVAQAFVDTFWTYGPFDWEKGVPAGTNVWEILAEDLFGYNHGTSADWTADADAMNGEFFLEQFFKEAEANIFGLIETYMPWYSEAADDYAGDTDASFNGDFPVALARAILKPALTTKAVALVDGVLVPLADAVEGTDYTVIYHDYAADFEMVDGKLKVTKVYCAECDAEFSFVVGCKADAVEAFGEDYKDVTNEFKQGFKTKFLGKPGVSFDWATMSYGASWDSADVYGWNLLDESSRCMMVALGGKSLYVGTAAVESAETFDAGIALYAGMALMSVAGSAVVIGKKKEF